MTNSIIQWNCRGLRPNFDELSLLVVKHNPLAVCLQETFLKDTDNITVRGFNLYHKCQETENRASGGVSILVNENIPQSIVTLNTNLQADFSWKVGPNPCGSDHFPILLENGGPPSLERDQRWKLAKANWDQFQHLCSTNLH